jgi:hypothetical protein
MAPLVATLGLEMDILEENSQDLKAETGNFIRCSFEPI